MTILLRESGEVGNLRETYSNLFFSPFIHCIQEQNHSLYCQETTTYKRDTYSNLFSSPFLWFHTRRESLTVRERPPSGPKVATPMTASTSPHPQLATPAGPPSSHPPATPTPSHDSAKLSDRDRQKLREQERRRREAVSITSLFVFHP